MSRKKKMKTEEDAMLGLIAISQKNAINGIGPKNKKKQSSIFEVLGDDKLEIIGDKDESPQSPPVKDKKFVKSGDVSWDKMKINRFVSSLNKPIEEWHSEQFYLHFVSLYRDKYPLSNIETPIMSGVVFMKKLLEDFENTLNRKPSPKIIIEYLGWFVKNEMDIFISQKGKFVLQDLRSKKAMRRFDNQYRIEEDITGFVETKPVFVVDNSFKNMNLVFKASRINFIMKYGIVITFNWLIREKLKNENDAKDIVIAILKDTIKEGKECVEKIISVTSSFSPYPSSYYNKLLVDIFNFVNMKNVNISYSETCKEIIFG